MSADGEIEVAVKAEGTDDAADELAEGSETQNRQGGLRQSMRGGFIGGLVGSLLGPLIDILNPMADLLKAYLAPVAIMLLRLMQPFLRMAIRFLPRWLSITEDIGDRIEQLSTLDKLLGLLAMVSPIGLMLAVLRVVQKGVASLAKDIWAFMKRLPGMIWSRLQQLPALIATEISKRLPNLPGGGDGGLFGDVLGGDPFGGNGGGGGGGTVVNIAGGLASFVERVERSQDIDFL
jgi:hypothetical protein